jgi:hypothetical protein
MTSPVIALAADHAGFELKNSMRGVLEARAPGGQDVVRTGTPSCPPFVPVRCP